MIKCSGIKSIFDDKLVSEVIFSCIACSFLLNLLIIVLFYCRCLNMRRLFAVQRLLQEMRSLCIHCVKCTKIRTAWEVSKSEVISGLYFPVFGLNTETYSANLRIQSEYRKLRAINDSVFGHFSRSDGFSPTHIFPYFGKIYAMISPLVSKFLTT